MIGRTNRPESEITQRINAIRASTDFSFRGMLAAGDFDIKSELRFRNLSGISFAGDDLRGIDFTGANLIGCNFKGALIAGARFERARLWCFDMKPASSISEAADWESYLATWSRPEESDTTDHEMHLPDWTVFFDAPMLPPMTVVPLNSGKYASGRKTRIALSIKQVDKSHVSASSAMSMVDIATTEERNGSLSLTWLDARRFLDWSTKATGRIYRTLSFDELDAIKETLKSDFVERKEYWLLRSGDPLLWCQDDRSGRAATRMVTTDTVLHDSLSAGLFLARPL